MRYFFEIAYNGKNYSGWQSQVTGIGVQSVVEESLSKLFRQEVKILGSGRTDTGVHCEQQFFQADLDMQFEASALVQEIGINTDLTRDRQISPPSPKQKRRC